ncbi:Transcription initiation factor TFIID subunit 3 like protein [Verticillium longisporum]|uniref:Transcription initiation factor TFIID subunit 3 like protein n=1 Tax=Verticillium longisporum TaxID=100787 RepID=A0A8I2ZNL9_VERLO|nr:Transcription initiation factor TFIID subunit 3 like protein [Verticillium longisporum]
MAPPTPLYHALLRPCILQILRATGYHATRPAVLDTLTELAARYLLTLCRHTAARALDNNPHHDPADEHPLRVADVRMALEDVGALGVVERFVEPDEGGRPATAPSGAAPEDKTSSTTTSSSSSAAYRACRGDDDTRGVDEFAAWFAGARCRAIRDMVVDGIGEGVVGTGNAAQDGDVPAGDYLHALMSRHSKSAEDSKFHDTILGRGNEHASDVLVEGATCRASPAGWT